MLVHGLSQKTEQLLIKLLKQNPHVESAILFGSRAIQTFKDNSDIDLVVDGKSLSISDIANIKAAIEQTSIPYEVDLLLMSSISNTKLIEHINTYGVKWI